jgi:hypothetical protein
MIVTMLNSTYAGSVPLWANDLAKSIKNGPYASSASEWIKCSSMPVGGLSMTTGLNDGAQEVLEANRGIYMTGDAHKPKKTKTKTAHPPTPTADPGGWACPLIWAQESNAYCCVRFLFPIPSYERLITETVQRLQLFPRR